MGSLYIVSTPIGNLQDMTLRAIEILRKVHFIACEDTRRGGLLLSKIGATQKPTLFSYFEHNEMQRIPHLLNILKNSEDVALISDSGTPTISDPGFKLVRSCIELGITVIPAPGPSAVIAALVLSGLPTDKFLFLGYPPKKQGNRKSLLESLKKMVTLDDKIHPTIIFFEAPHRIVVFLKELRAVFGEIDIVICRELTKIHEETRREKVSAAIFHFEKVAPKGEFVILLNTYHQYS